LNIISFKKTNFSCKDNDTFFLEYESDGDENSSYTGTVENLSDVQQRVRPSIVSFYKKYLLSY